MLLVHYRGGLQGSTLEDAEMIARLGYVVFAEDMLGKDVVRKTVPEMTALTDIYNKDRALMRMDRVRTAIRLRHYSPSRRRHMSDGFAGL